jgi:hypothetical protein
MIGFVKYHLKCSPKKCSGTCVRKIDVTYIWKQNCISESNKNVKNQENNVDSEHWLLGFAHSTRIGYGNFAWQWAKNDRS